ncbi:DUF2179 domain-containing protein [Lutibacter sp. B2]|nr:DUF2179 domain-containing protein [Lutibacter sp. B2]
MSKLLLIIIIQLLYVPMLTLRTICMVKNLKLFTAIFGFAESLIYIFGLAIVLSGEQKAIEMIVYSFGFAMGLVVGIYVEQKLAIGFLSIQVNINHMNTDLIDILRNQGFGVTVYSVEGKLGERKKLDILTKRKRESELIKLVYQYEPEAFIIAYEPKMFRGGYLTEMMKKRMLIRKKNNNDVSHESLNAVEKTVETIKREAKALKRYWG